MDSREFNAWLAAYRPLPAELLGDSQPRAFRGMSYTEINAYRYRLTLEKLEQAVSLRAGDCVLDIGAFPGGWASLLDHRFARGLQIDLLGLGLSPEFRERFRPPRFRVIDFDVDIENPAGKSRGREIPLDPGRYRAVSLLETIEHLYNPLPLLCRIGESLAPDGRLILTTDNPLWFGFAYQALRYRRSPWGPVQASHLFNRGDWRPHIRLYDLPDLACMLESSGMRVVFSCHFNDHYGLCSLQGGKLKSRAGMKSALSRLPSLLLPERYWANRILVVAARSGDGGARRIAANADEDLAPV